MKVGVKYVVTKGSSDGTLSAGDHIMLNHDGTLTCYEAQGWLEEEDVEIALVGARYEIDRIWWEARLTHLEAELNSLRNLE